MSTVVTAVNYDDAKHPRVVTGPEGGQFTSAPTTAKPTAKTRTPARPARRAPAAAPLPDGMARGRANSPTAVKRLQRLIKTLGLGDLAPDGVYGPATEAAVKAVQAKLGMKQTGVASPAVVQRLKIAKALSPCVGRAVKAAGGPDDEDPPEQQDDTDEFDLDDDESEEDVGLDLFDDDDFPDDGELVTAAAGHDVTPGHDELHHYWVAGPGLARWAGSPTPWTTLVKLLVEHVDPPKPLEVLKRWASRWFIEVFHFAAGSDLNRVTHGKPPRGHRVGPG